MGGSLGLAIRRRGLPWHVAGYTRNAARGRRAFKRGALDTLHRSATAAVQDADLVVLCAPVLALVAQARECRSGLKPGAVVTDVGSTKAYVDREIAEALRGSGAHFIGSHPLCGSEQQGIEYANPDLYDKALVMVTTSREAQVRAAKLVRSFWKRVGARVLELDAREHDRIMACTSHLPHLVASLLSVTVGRSGRADKLAGFCGSGFADTSRVAEGSPDVWHDIVRTNRTNLIEELRAYKNQTERLIKMLDDADFEGVQRFLEQGQAARRELVKGKQRKDV